MESTSGFSPVAPYPLTCSPRHPNHRHGARPWLAGPHHLAHPQTFSTTIPSFSTRRSAANGRGAFGLRLVLRARNRAALHGPDSRRVKSLCRRAAGPSVMLVSFKMKCISVNKKTDLENVDWEVASVKVYQTKRQS